jgi:opacity protein-like surface antigen
MIATAGGKVGIYGIRMIPYGIDAKEYSRAGWGGGIHVVVPAPQLGNILAGVAGIEFVNLLSGTTYYQDRVTLLRVEQQTSQNYGRLFLGGQVGGHGNGFLRPHAGANVALVWYSFTIDVVIPNDYNRENEIRQKLRDDSKLVFGYDFTFGLDLNFNNNIALDGGVKYVKSFSVPQQLGEGSVTVHPQYFQVYLGIGMSFDMISNY